MIDCFGGFSAAACYVTGEEPVEVTAIAHQPADDPRFREVPESVVFTLRYPSGAPANCNRSVGSRRSGRYWVICADSWIEIDPAFSYRGLRLRSKLGNAKSGKGAEYAEMFIEQVDHFAAEMDHFSDSVLNGTARRTPGEMGLADMRIVVAIHEAARTGRIVKI